MFAVLACSSVVVIERQNALRQAEVDSIFARSSAIVAQQSSYCDVCAVVIPNDTYKGKNLGSFIDSADCVVRFSAHRQELLDDLAPEDCPSDADYGTKDDIRIMNANAEVIGKLNDDPCFGPEDQPGACREASSRGSTRGDGGGGCRSHHGPRRRGGGGSLQRAQPPGRARAHPRVRGL